MRRSGENIKLDFCTHPELYSTNSFKRKTSHINLTMRKLDLTKVISDRIKHQKTPM